MSDPTPCSAGLPAALEAAVPDPMRAAVEAVYEARHPGTKLGGWRHFPSVREEEAAIRADLAAAAPHLVAAEREECAKMAYQHAEECGEDCGVTIWSAIRARATRSLEGAPTSGLQAIADGYTRLAQQEPQPKATQGETT